MQHSAFPHRQQPQNISLLIASTTPQQMFDVAPMISLRQEQGVGRGGDVKKTKTRPVNPTLGSRIKQRREQLGLTQEELAKNVGMRQSAIAEIEAGRIRRPTRLFEIARALRTSDEWLLGQGPNTQKPGVNTYSAVYAEVMEVPVEGAIETGVRRAVDVFDDALPNARVTVARDPRFPTARMVAFVNNDRLELADVRPGDVIIGVMFEDAELPLRQNMLVVVQATGDGGKTIERTLRKVATFKDRIELLPLSSGKGHRSVVIGAGYDPEQKVMSREGDHVRIVAVATRLQKELPV